MQMEAFKIFPAWIVSSSIAVALVRFPNTYYFIHTLLEAIKDLYVFYY